MPSKVELDNLLFPVELVKRASLDRDEKIRAARTTVSVVSVHSPTVQAVQQQEKTAARQGARASGMMNGGRSFPRRFSGRPIPKRGQVKVGIVVGLANSVVSIFSRSRATRGCATPTHLAH
ncbi:hypothetical protein HKD37_08G021142 [Glycine soja]|nr:hypothetical protein D0Y65_019723 [Glycine soja]